MIAYDLDGVLVSDVWSLDLEYRIATRNFLKPVFVPQGEYAIITGRHVADARATMEWVALHLQRNPPVALHIGATEGGARASAAWKIRVLREHPEYRTFVESDEGQYKEIRDALPDTRVLHFEYELGARLAF